MYHLCAEVCPGVRESKQTYLFLLLSSHPHWERSGQEQDDHPIDDQPSARKLADLPTKGQRFFSEDQRGEERHHRKIHEAERKEDHKQEPAATETVDSMLQPHTEGSTIPIMPAAKNELHRRAAFRQADVLQGRELIETGHQQDNPTGASSVFHEPHGLSCQLLDQDGERVCHYPAQGPDEQIGADEDPGGDKGAILLPFAGIDFAEHEDHWGCCGEHHGDHHDDPDGHEQERTHAHRQAHGLLAHHACLPDEQRPGKG